MSLDKENNNMLEIEFEVEPEVRSRWRVVIMRNGRPLFQGTRTAKGASPSFTLRLLKPDLPGQDNVVATATRLGKKSQKCEGRLSIN